MSVTFDRAQLIKVAQKAIAEHDKAKAAYDAEVEKFKTNHAAEHTDSTRAKARQLRDVLTKALKSPGPITRQQVDKALSGSYRVSETFYSPPDEYTWKNAITRPTGLLTPLQVRETKALLQVLGAATGKEVTANELKLLGLKNLGPVFTAAAGENGVEVGR